MSTWVPIGLIFLTFVVLTIYSFIFISSNKISDPRVFIAIGITDVFILATMCTFAIIMGWGTGSFPKLDEAFMKWLGAATVGEVASMLGIVLGWYFKGTQALPQGTHAGQTDSGPA
jgi:hypothetical protein